MQTELNNTKEKKSIIRKLLFSKSVYGSIIFAVALWAYASLNETYVTLVQVPLIVNVPQNRAIENSLPFEINVEVKGTGWHLFNLIFFNNNKLCNINLDGTDIKDNFYLINRSVIVKSLENLVNVEAKEVIPETLSLKTGPISESFVEVKPNIEIKTAPGYTVVGDYLVKPSKIKVKGNEKILKSLSFISTNKVTFDNVRKSFVTNIFISDSIRTILKLSSNQVAVSINVQRIAEATFNDVPINIDWGNYKNKDIIKPEIISITLRGGINQIEKVTPDMITAYLDLKTIQNDTTGIIKPKISFPSGVEVISMNPPYLYHYKKLSLSYNKIK